MRDELVAPVGIINRCCTCLIANLACFIVFVTKSLLAHMSTKCHLLLGQLKIRGLRRSATNLWIAILDPFFVNLGGAEETVMSGSRRHYRLAVCQRKQAKWWFSVQRQCVPTLG